MGIDYNQDADYIAPNGQLYWEGELDFTNLNIKVMREETIMGAINDIDSIRCMVEDIHEELVNTPDYWDKLLHQYAGMAMQGMMSYIKQITPKKGRSFCDEIVDISYKVATALVEKLKGE